MLESIRSHRRWMTFFLLALVFPSFVVTGIYGYSRFTDADNAVARIGGQAVTAQELDAAQRQRIDQFRQMLGANFDPAMFDTDEARAATLRALLAQRALVHEASRSNMSVPADRLREVIAGIPAFQQDGRFDYERYRMLLTAQGRSELTFERELHDELVRQQLLQAISNSAIVPGRVVEQINRIAEEQREIRELRFEPAAYFGRIVVGDDKVKTYYEANRAQFEIAESMRVEYLLLTMDDIASQVAVPEAELRTYYEQNKGRYGTDEQRRARHILLTVGDDGTARDRATVRRTAEDLLKRVRENPDRFPKLASEFSKDPGSAQAGGDLGLFGRNMMVKPFEDAAFALKRGEISDIVETEFGLHIIQVTEIQGADVKPFEVARAEIEQEYRRQQAQRKFAEAAEQFTNLVYEQSDSLQPAADKLGLRILTADRLTRAGVPERPGVPQIFTPRAIQALFSDDAIRNKRNTEAIEVAPNTLLAARVAEHRPAALRPLDEVREAIIAQVRLEEAARLARNAAEERLAALKAQVSDAGFSAVRTVSRTQPQGLPTDALRNIMRVPADSLPTYVGAVLDGGAYGVFHVMAAKTPIEPNAEQRAATARAVERQIGAAADDAYVQALQAKHKAQVLRPELKAAVPAQARRDK